MVPGCCQLAEQPFRVSPDRATSFYVPRIGKLWRQLYVALPQDEALPC